MARAVIVCSDCGKQLAPTDMFCPQCGAKVEREGPIEGISSIVMCQACGQRNSPGNNYCESCGAKLPGTAPFKASSPLDYEKKTARTKESILPKTSHASNQSPAFKFETWHYAVGAILFALIVFFIYDEIPKTARSNASVQSTPLNFPSQQTPSKPPSKEILDAIARLEATVKNNPNDSGAKLLLANAIHDGAMHDARLLPRAIEAYRNYLQEKPGDPNARVDLGICYFELGKIDSAQSAGLFIQAINEMETTLKNNPKHQAGAFNLGIVYLYSGNVRDSNKWLRKAAELNPESDLGKRAKTILEQHLQAG